MFYNSGIGSFEVDGRNIGAAAGGPIERPRPPPPKTPPPKVLGRAPIVASRPASSATRSAAAALPAARTTVAASPAPLRLVAPLPSSSTTRPGVVASPPRTPTREEVIAANRTQPAIVVPAPRASGGVTAGDYYAPGPSGASSSPSSDELVEVATQEPDRGLTSAEPDDRSALIVPWKFVGAGVAALLLVGGGIYLATRPAPKRSKSRRPFSAAP
jgi:hypothetical protein